jgi:hypothetical protein
MSVVDSEKGKNPNQEEEESLLEGIVKRMEA